MNIYVDSYDEKYQLFRLAELSKEEKTYLDEIFLDTICKGQVYYLRDFKKDRAYTGKWLEANVKIALNRYFIGDLGFYPNSFKNASVDVATEGFDADYSPRYVYKKVRSSHSIANLYRIRTFAIDIDHRRAKLWEDMDPLIFWNMLLDMGVCDHIPPISYVEYGHQIRLIYVLDEPIYAGSKTATKALKCLQKRICSTINKILGESVADPQPFNSFYRMPGSMNTKNCSRVSVFSVSGERLSFQEMLDYIPKPEWYDRWKEKKVTRTKKNPKVYEIHNVYTLYHERKDFLREIARTRDDIHRYSLIWCYVNNELMIDTVNALETAKEINRELIKPLTEKELERKIKGFRKHYKISNESICEKIGIEKGAFMTKREKDKIEKIRAGKTRKQIADKHYLEAKALKEKGYTQKEIAEKLGMSIRSIKYYYAKMKTCD